MRNTDEIPEEEFRNRTKMFQSLLAEPYTKALHNKQKELFHNPDCNEWKRVLDQSSFGMKPEYQLESDNISKELDLFRRNKYPELVFEIENNVKLKEVEELKKDKEYNNLVKGLIYHSGEIHMNEVAIDEIAKLNKQISELIETRFPNLFKMT